MIPPIEVRDSTDADVFEHDEVIAERLTAAMGDESPDRFMKELLKIAKAHGVAKVAKASGLRRESLYRALAPGAHPRFETIRAVLRALNVDLRITKADFRVTDKVPSVVPVPARRAAKKLKENATKKIERRRKAARVW
jgi:probable addiction module antidote protein